jgi:hypothetical protein
MTLNLTQLVLDGIVILREPKDATAAAAQERLALVAPTLGGFLVGAAAGGLGYLIAGFYERQRTGQLLCYLTRKLMCYRRSPEGTLASATESGYLATKPCTARRA